MRYLLALMTLISVASAAVDNLKAFPPAEKGMTRFVLNLPKAPNEDDLKVEVLIGKTVKTDAVNRYFFGGQLILRKLGPITGTLMAPPPDSPQVERFITLGGEPRLHRYNSRLPLVIYVPEGVEVRYRLWRADAQATPVKPG
jgi:ecotin